ncbi:2-dehydro-3-deoxygalactonokinase [Singulisphaera sp. PoT]|uniref:2-dehydro-3-deoxygalactonokinase n=1 Tax=Singulisphaera sp. PoT TaxID=3411797 RepID=UPI003BF50057
MAAPQIQSAIAIDVGTTNTRARYLLDGKVIDTAKRPVGVRDNVGTSGKYALVDALRDAIQDVVKRADQRTPDVIVASGMLTSEVGLVTVPHVLAPAGLDELAAGAVLKVVPAVVDLPILFIPGVKTPAREGEDGWMSADLMRGEECESFGAWEVISPGFVKNPTHVSGDDGLSRGTSTVFVWPGSHTKIVEMDRDGRIVRSHTSLVGELTMAMARHTLLVASLPGGLPDEVDEQAMELGSKAEAREGLGRVGFLVRIAAVNQNLTEHQRASFLIGALLSNDIRHLAKHPMFGQDHQVWVGGRQPQRSIYARWLVREGMHDVREVDDDLCEDASARGALAVAMRRRELRSE